MAKGEKNYEVKTPHGIEILAESEIAEAKLKGFTVLRELKDFGSEAPIIPPKVRSPLECAICGFTAKSDAGLKTHQKKHQ